MRLMRMEGQFTFTTALDGDVLTTFYDGDLNYAMMMFEIFLAEIPREVERLRGQLALENLEECRSALHKMKPNFVMVGNEPLTEFCSKLEKNIKEGHLSFEQAKPEIESVLEEINQTLILLEQETIALKQHLNQ